MTPSELNRRGKEVSARLQNVQRRTKEAMDNDDLPEAIAVAGKEGVKVARAMMITSMPPDKIVILCEGDLERVVLELEACVATMERFIDDAIRQKKEDPEASAKAAEEARQVLKGTDEGEMFSMQLGRDVTGLDYNEEDEDEDKPNTFQFSAPTRLQ